MIKAITTKNTKEIARTMNSDTYCIEGHVQESGRFNNKHAEFRFWFDRKKEWPSLVIRTRRNFSKRFSTNNQRIHRIVKCYIDPADTENLINAIMEHVCISHDMEIEAETNKRKTA